MFAQKPIDWTDPKWSNPLVHVASNGSFVTSSPKEDS